MAAAVIILAAIKATAFIVGPLMLALLFVAVLRPAYLMMLKKKFPIWLATLITIGLFILIIVFLGWVFSLAITSTLTVIQTYGPEIAAMFQSYDVDTSTLPSYSEGLNGLLKSVDPAAITGLVMGLISALTDFISNIVLVFFLFIFTLTGVPLIMKTMHETFGDNHQLTLKSTSFLENMARYFILRTMVNAVTGAGIALGCYLLGIPGALVWGLLTFVLSYIPYIGMFIACIPPGIIAFAEGGLTGLAVFVVLCLIMNGLAEQVLSPVITGRGLSISPILIFVSFIFWGWLLGSIGLCCCCSHDFACGIVYE